MGEAPRTSLADDARCGFALAMVAAEASGDLLASAMLKGLRAEVPRLAAYGVGGRAMCAQGFEAWTGIEELSVRGYAEVLSALPRLLALRRSLARRILARRPTAFVGIDAPDFNLGLERRLRDHGVPTVHFIGPSIWAWRPERIEAIRRSVNHMLLVFPFEKPIYDAAGISATYVGHPLADVLNPSTDTAAARLALELPLNRPVVALLPGSRPDEVRYMGRTVLQTAAWIHRQRPDCHFVLPAASPALLETLRRQAAALRLDSSLPLTLVSGQSHRAMLAADTVLVASGTATLEAALLGRPMVIFYRMAALSFLLMRNRGLLPWIGLPNILCRESLVPEFIQHEASPEALGAALLAQLDDNSLRGRLHQRFTDMHGTLARGCAKRSAEAILGVCESVKEAA
jgi:lipid-A-disaccharide synthase